MATAVFLTVDPYTGEVAYTSTGHPPSLLLDVEADTVTRLDQANVPPLGWAAGKEIREARLTLPANGALLAYTDGLVERRGVSIDDGIDRLRSCCATVSELAAAEAADRLLDYLVIPLSATDDIALLLVRHTGVPSIVEIEIPADSTLMHDVRTARSERGSSGAVSARSSRPTRCSPSRRRATTPSSTATPGGPGRSSCGSSIARIC